MVSVEVGGLHWRVLISVTPGGSGSDLKEPVTRRKNVGLLFSFSVKFQLVPRCNAESLCYERGGCAGAPFVEDRKLESDEERAVEAPSSSPISMIASPPRVSSVSVGDCGPFSMSLTMVSPVMARIGAMSRLSDPRKKRKSDKLLESGGTERYV